MPPYSLGFIMKSLRISCQLFLYHTMMQNPRYLGDDFYPAILTAEIAQAVEAERLRRDALYKGTRYTKKAVIMVIPTRFSMKRTALKYEDPIKQAEYAYSQIKEVK